MKKIKMIAMLLMSMIAGNVCAQTITAKDVTIAKGGTADVTFTITAESKAAIASFWLTLPTGVTIQYDADEEDYVYALGSDMTVKSHSATVKKSENGDFYVLVMNTSGKEFKAATGDYITLTLEASENAVSGTAAIKEIVLGDINAKGMNTVTESSFAVTVGDATGISSISAAAEEGNLFDLQGRRVLKGQKGVFIQSGKKIVVK